MKTNESGVGGKKLRAGSKGKYMYHVPHSNAMATNHFNVGYLQHPYTENRDRNRVGGRVYMSKAPKQLISLRKGQKIFNTFSAVRNHGSLQHFSQASVATTKLLCIYTRRKQVW